MAPTQTEQPTELELEVLWVLWEKLPLFGATVDDSLFLLFCKLEDLQTETPAFTERDGIEFIIAG